MFSPSPLEYLWFHKTSLLVSSLFIQQKNNFSKRIRGMIEIDEYDNLEDIFYSVK